MAPAPFSKTAPSPSAPAHTASKSVLVGLIGRGIALSQSPLMHEREGLRLGLNYVYKRLDFDVLGLSNAALGDILTTCEQIGFSGVNVTHPFKQATIAYLDDLSPEARSIGAVNTVVFENGKRIGHNTDCWGFVESVARGLPGASLDTVVLVGAGGAGRAVLQALIQLGAKSIRVFDESTDVAAGVVGALTALPASTECVAITDLTGAIASADGVVNATPIGMEKYPGIAIPVDSLMPHHWVADIVYFPEQTQLITTARAKGCRVLTGGGMAVYQAVRAFELFSGTRPDAEAMARVRQSA